MTMRELLVRDFLANHLRVVSELWRDRSDSENRLFIRRSLRKLREYRNNGIIQVF